MDHLDLKEQKKTGEGTHDDTTTNQTTGLSIQTIFFSGANHMIL